MIKPKKDKNLCLGCRDNFYNGNNDRGIKTCWRFKTAKVKKTVVTRIDQPPPFSRLEYNLDCYGSSGYGFLTQFDEIKKGEHKGKYCYLGSRNYWENKEVKID